MKKGWVFVLLISVGLNVGLGARMVRQGQSGALPGRAGTGRAEQAGRRWERPAPGDTLAWRQFMGRRIDQLTQRLNLRPEQVAVFEATQQTTGRAMRLKRRDLYQARARLQELMAAEQVDRSVVRQMMAEMAVKQAQMDSLAAETLLGELEILDSDQRSLYLDFMPDGAGRRPGHGRRGPGLHGE